jgi:hypothetical protein
MPPAQLPGNADAEQRKSPVLLHPVALAHGLVLALIVGFDEVVIVGDLVRISLAETAEMQLQLNAVPLHAPAELVAHRFRGKQ